MSVAAVITAYVPDGRLVAAARSAAAQTDVVCVVDNTPGGMAADIQVALSGLHHVEVVGIGANTGLAAALNRGLAVCERAGIDVVLLLDQDSAVPGDLIATLLPHLANGDVAAVGPAPWDERHARFIDPRTRWRRSVSDRPAIIVSGMLVRLEDALAIGGFREDFFVDGVDQDFCLRLRANGRRVLQDKTALLPHELGDARVTRFGVRVSNHPTWRLYWVFRSGCVIARDHWRREPRWVLANLAILARWMMVSALFEGARRERLRAMVAGCRDGAGGATARARYLPDGAVTPAGRPGATK